MRILAIDVGTGTQDMMIYDTQKELENSIKLVLPSPHLYISQQIREIENDIYLFTCKSSKKMFTLVMISKKRTNFASFFNNINTQIQVL